MPDAAQTLHRDSVRVSSSGALRIGVVADTHGNPHPDAAKHLSALSPDCLLHAGDIGDLAVIDALRAIAPVHVVRGNIDGHAPHLPDLLALEIADDGGRLFTLLLIHIAVNGPKLRADAARAAKKEGASLVVCGHSHVPFIGSDKGHTVFNPGSIGPRRFQLPIVFGTIDIGPKGVSLHHYDCETGLRWMP